MYVVRGGQAASLEVVCQRAIFAKRTFEHTNGKTDKTPSTTGLTRDSRKYIQPSLCVVAWLHSLSTVSGVWAFSQVAALVVQGVA